MVVERETKVLVGPDFELPDLDGLVDGLVVASDEVVDQEAVYFDTSDLRLTRVGASLRYRSDDGWTVKLPTYGTTSSLVRAQHRFGGDVDAPPAGAVDLLSAWIRTAPLAAVANVTTQRHRYILTDPVGIRLAEIDDDQVETVAHDGATGRFREIEIELDDHAPARLAKQLTKCVRAGGATERSLVPKVARAVRVHEGIQSGTKPNTTKSDVTTRAFVQASLGDSLHRLIVHDPIIRIGEDREGVHQARVATRKLRANLRTLAPVLADEWGEQLRSELRWLGQQLGHARDADVLDALLQATTSELPDPDRDTTRDLLAQLTVQRSRARDELLEAMRSERYTSLLDALVEAANRPQLRPELELQPATDVVTPVLFEQWRRLRRAARRLADEPTDPEWHRVRRHAKQARYAMEAASTLTDNASSPLAQRAEKVQAVLGAHQDRVVARQWLSDAAPDQPTAAFVAGELAGLLKAQQREIRADAHRLVQRTRKRHSH